MGVRLRLHYKWQEKLVAQQRVNGITSYESYRDDTLRRVAQRYFKIRHEKTSQNGKQHTWFFFHFLGEVCQHQVKINYPDDGRKKPIIEKSSKKDGDKEICVIPLEKTGLVETYGAEISANEFANV